MQYILSHAFPFLLELIHLNVNNMYFQQNNNLVHIESIHF